MVHLANEPLTRLGQGMTPLLCLVLPSQRPLQRFDQQAAAKYASILHLPRPGRGHCNPGTISLHKAKSIQ
jgi:hypothetical protein